MRVLEKRLPADRLKGRNIQFDEHDEEFLSWLLDPVYDLSKVAALGNAEETERQLDNPTLTQNEINDAFIHAAAFGRMDCFLLLKERAEWDAGYVEIVFSNDEDGFTKVRIDSFNSRKSFAAAGTLAAFSGQTAILAEMKMGNDGSFDQAKETGLHCAAVFGDCKSIPFLSDINTHYLMKGFFFAYQNEHLEFAKAIAPMIKPELIKDEARYSLGIDLAEKAVPFHRSLYEAAHLKERGGDNPSPVKKNRTL